jgi:hypothetical protein
MARFSQGKSSLPNILVRVKVGICATAQSVNIHMKYQEWATQVQTAKIRKGGDRYQDFQDLIDAGDTEAFSKAKNLFNKPKTPQKDLTPLLP